DRRGAARAADGVVADAPRRRRRCPPAARSTRRRLMAQPGLTIPRLSIVVPYRERPEQLARFVPHLNAYFTRDKLDKDIPWRLTIVEQAAGQDFNRGLLKNIGFLLTEAEADY